MAFASLKGIMSLFDFFFPEYKGKNKTTKKLFGFFVCLVFRNRISL